MSIEFSYILRYQFNIPTQSVLAYVYMRRIAKNLLRFRNFNSNFSHNIRQITLCYHFRRFCYFISRMVSRIILQINIRDDLLSILQKTVAFPPLPSILFLDVFKNGRRWEVRIISVHKKSYSTIDVIVFYKLASGNHWFAIFCLTAWAPN